MEDIHYYLFILKKNLNKEGIMIDILFSLAGIVILIKGKVNISEKRVIAGSKARWLGALFILCIPLGYLLRLLACNAKSIDLLWIGFVYPGLLIIITIIYACTAKANNVSTQLKADGKNNE